MGMEQASEMLATVSGATPAGFIQIICFLMLLALCLLLWLMHKNRRETKAERDFVQKNHEKRIRDLEDSRARFEEKIFSRLNPIAESVAKIQGMLEGLNSPRRK
jgi:transposase